MQKKKVLINFVYYHPVGHVLEAIKYAKGYSIANKNIDIYLLINSKSTVDLTKTCKWIKKTFPIDVLEVKEKGINAKCLLNIPKTWDYIITDERAINFYGMEDTLIHFHKFANDYFKSKIGKGYTNDWRENRNTINLKYTRNSKTILKIPKNNLNSVKQYNFKGLKLCVMLAGSENKEKYPSIEFWISLFKDINKEYPNCKIYLTGITKNSLGRTITKAHTISELTYLCNQFDNVINCYDIGLWNQLALIKQCNVFISPHTGFAFLAPSVGTPWLAISCREWPEYLYNKVKFYNVLPNCIKYPCFLSKNKACLKAIDNKERVLCMDDNHLFVKKKDIIDGIRFLTDKSTTYKQSMELHKNNLKKNNVNKKSLFWFDNVFDL